MAISNNNFDWWFQRIFGRLPAGWFPSDGPVISSIVGQVAEGASLNNDQLFYAQNQTRVSTASDMFLELIAQDYFGAFNFPRRSGETDDSYRSRILGNLLIARGTRGAMIEVLTNLTGNVPDIFEPIRDACAWDQFGWDYPKTKLGDYNDPYTCWITIQPPPGPGIPLAYGYDSGSYDVNFAYGDINLLASVVADNEIYRAVIATAPAGVRVLVYILP